MATFISWIDVALYLDRPEHYGYQWQDEPELEVVIVQTISLPRIDKPSER